MVALVPWPRNARVPLRASPATMPLVTRFVRWLPVKTQAWLMVTSKLGFLIMGPVLEFGIGVGVGMGVGVGVTV